MLQRSPSTLLLLLALACPVVVDIVVLTPGALAQEADSLGWTETYVTAIEAQTELSLRQQSLDVPLTRIEFAQWLVEFFGYIPDSTQLVMLNDVEPNSPDFQNAQAVVQAGVMRLYDGGEFRPEGDITKLEALAILVRALQIPAPAPDQVTRWMALYADADQVPEVGHPFIAMAGSAGLLLNVPDPTLIAPNLILRRGDGAALLHQTLVAQRRIPAIEPPVAQLAPAEQPAVTMDPTQSAPPPVPSLPIPNGTTPPSSLISAFRVFPSAGSVAAGQQLQLGVQGIPGGLARVEIGGIGVIQLQETSPGLYEGSYTVTELNQPVQGTEVRVELFYNDQRDEAQQRFPTLSLGSAPPPPIPPIPFASQPTPLSPAPA
ncbi:MAG: S-layer homology domain-containing protein, partial [Synechococcaceae cyanobacterium SM2_3_2]|nr:S-layer homology domain-containing protein [Synechococcaceae cyanobacterium SM2_3_2]